jgi:hypothetical protein
MQTPFKNKQAESEFINKGFTTFPFLEASEIDFVRNIYAELNGAEKRLEQRQFFGVNYSVSALSLSKEGYALATNDFNKLLEQLPDINITDTAILRHAKIVLPQLPTAKDIIAKSSLENSL